MKALELKRLILASFPYVPSVRATDKVYYDGICYSEMHDAYMRWKYGFLGLFAPAPLYHKEGQDCDDEVRAFVVWYRRKFRKDGVALPLFHVGDADHAYVGFLNQSNEVKVMDLNDGLLKEPVVNFVEMV